MCDLVLFIKGVNQSRRPKTVKFLAPHVMVVVHSFNTKLIITI